jgi:hypothetical protein
LPFLLVVPSDQFFSLIKIWKFCGLWLLLLVEFGFTERSWVRMRLYSLQSYILQSNYWYTFFSRFMVWYTTIDYDMRVVLFRCCPSSMWWWSIDVVKLESKVSFQHGNQYTRLTYDFLRWFGLLFHCYLAIIGFVVCFCPIVVKHFPVSFSFWLWWLSMMLMS